MFPVWAWSLGSSCWSPEVAPHVIHACCLDPLLRGNSLQHFQIGVDLSDFSQVVVEHLKVLSNSAASRVYIHLGPSLCVLCYKSYLFLEEVLLSLNVSLSLELSLYLVDYFCFYLCNELLGSWPLVHILKDGFLRLQIRYCLDSLHCSLFFLSVFH